MSHQGDFHHGTKVADSSSSVPSEDQQGPPGFNRQVTRVITCSYSREPCRLNGPLLNGGPRRNLVPVVKKSCRREPYRSRPPQMEGEENG
jgi:hypothetical protein